MKFLCLTPCQALRFITTYVTVLLVFEAEWRNQRVNESLQLRRVTDVLDVAGFPLQVHCSDVYKMYEETPLLVIPRELRVGSG
jgi:hypothetical protein